MAAPPSAYLKRTRRIKLKRVVQTDFNSKRYMRLRHSLSRTWGDDRGVIKPIALEGGGDIKEIKPFIGTETEITRNTNPYKYYKYIKK